jgi:hypothetical protein
MLQSRSWPKQRCPREVSKHTKKDAQEAQVSMGPSTRMVITAQDAQMAQGLSIRSTPSICLEFDS